MRNNEELKYDVIYWLNRGGTIHYNPGCDPAIPRIWTHREWPGVIPFPVSVLIEIVQEEPLQVDVDAHGVRTYSIMKTAEVAEKERKRARIWNNASVIRECRAQLWGDYDPETAERIYHHVTSKAKRMEN